MSACFVAIHNGSRCFTKLCGNDATAYAWRKYFDRRGLSAAIVDASLGRNLARVEAIECQTRREDIISFKAQQKALRLEKIAKGWKPYLRGRWPGWCGMLFGYPLPGERQAR